jgi:branched-chain amino acid transport system substrate-binding protein
MHLYETLKKTGGKTDGDSSSRGRRAWVGDRGGPSPSIETRDIIQTIYIRRVEKVCGQLRNVEFKVENVKDPVKAA